MIAYLEKYDTTVEVPDDIGQDQLSDINNNFHTYVDQKPAVAPVEPKPSPTDPPTQMTHEAQPAEPAQKWQPNFYESVVKPLLPAVAPSIPLGDIYDTASAMSKLPGSAAFAGKDLEEGTFGLAKPVTDQLFAQAYKDHPAAAAAGEIAGGVGSLLVAGGAVRIAGLGGQAAIAGKSAVEAGFAAGERFIPRAIMTGATFGTRTFIAETVKAFHDGGVDLEQFGKDVLKDTAFGSMFGAIGGVANAAASVSSAGALGFLSSKMSGADNREASLNAAIWAAFETVGSVGKSSALRLEALSNLKSSIGEYIGERNPNIEGKDAAKAASAFVDHAVQKAGFENAEDIAKSGPENLLEGIEKVNQAVRTARVPNQGPESHPYLPKLPAAIPPEPADAGPPSTPTPAPQTPVEKAVDYVKGLMGLKEAPTEPTAKVPIAPGASYDEMIEGLKKQGHDISKIPEEAFPEDLKDVYHFEQGRTQKAEIGKSLSEISERLNVLGIKPDEQEAVFGQYGLKQTDTLGQPSLRAAVPALMNAPIEDQYRTAYQALAAQRGIDKGEKFDSRTMEDAQHAVNLINGYFSPKSQEIKEFAKAHGEQSDHDVAQMAYDRGMIDEPNNDLLKVELQKANQEKIAGSKTSYQIASTLLPRLVREPKAATPGFAEEVSAKLKESADEITNVLVPANAAPLAAQITRENLGKMARSYDMAEAALESAKALFESQSKEANLNFIDKMERGQDQADTKLDPIAKTLRKLLDDKRKEIQALGTGKMQSFIENYFPHIWDQGEKEVGQAVQKAAKRPFEGSKSFLKKRKIEFTKDGIAMGLTPVSYNPVDLTLLKIREMDKYLMAHRTINEYKSQGLAQYVKIGGEVPEGWTKIDDRISTVFKSPMVAVEEAYDAHLMQTLNEVGQSLGIDLERKMKVSAEGDEFKNLLGVSVSQAPGVAGRVETRFASPESTLAHELGHQIDNIYGLKSKFLSDDAINKELSELAKERYAGKEVPQKFKSYVQEPSEKMAVMFEAYVHAPDLLKEKAPKTYAKLSEFLRNPDPINGPSDILKPLAELKPSLVKETNKGEVYAGGAVIAGHIYAQPDTARIINNYLSPGLQKYALYQGVRYAGNVLNQFQLSLSAFHLGFTSVDAIVSKVALAVNQVASGHPIRAVGNALQSPFAPVQNIIRGNSLLKAWRGEGKTGVDDVLATAMASAGGRASMDQFYATSAYDQMKHHFETGNLVRGLLHIPLSIVEIASKPIMEYIVPRQKLGVFADIMKMEMENHPGMTHDDTRRIAQKAWDSVDNRMGQLVYDNLFWNRILKDSLMASVRSVGWNLGTIRELGGGAADAAEFASQAVRGKNPEFTYRMAYCVALPIVAATIGAVYQYLRTGKGPSELKDYFYPKTGGLDANGHPARVALPTYMKDLYHWKENPIKTATDKFSPLISTLADMLQNKDYFGVKIRNEDDPIVKQVASEAAFMLKQMTPFSIRNMQRNLETDNKSLPDVVGPWIGITPAPYDIDQTKAQREAHEIAASHQEIGGRTEEQAERSRLLSDLTRQYRRGDPKATENLLQAFEHGLISHHQMQSVIVHANMTPLQKMVSQFTLPEAQRVYAKANDEEKAQIERIVRKKMINQEREYVPSSGSAQ